MRWAASATVVALFSSVLAAAPAPQAPQAPQPVFRADVELVSVDITALDNNGRQVTDLTAAELQVEIDGDRRQVSTVEYIRSADPLRVIGAPHKVVVPDETFSSSNAKGAPRGRLIVLLIDQGNIRAGAARSSMNSAKKFVDTLTPDDRRAGDAVTVLTSYLETNPADSAALLAAIFGAYARHLNGPQPATLAADRANLAKWSKAYAATKDPMQPLVEAWVKHVQSLK